MNRRLSMKLFFIIIGLLSIGDFSWKVEISYATVWDELNRKVQKAYREKRYEEGSLSAEKAMRYALEKFGKEHINTLISMINLADLYQAKNQYEKADSLYQEALSLNEKILPGNEDLYISELIIRRFDRLYSKQIRLYSKQGRYDKVESLYLKMVEVSNNYLGKEHPDKLNYLIKLSLFYYYQGRFNEAEPLFEKLLLFSRNVLKEQIPDILVCMNKLAEIYELKCQYYKAENLYKEAIKIGEKVLQNEHLLTLISKNNLALLYQSKGLYDEAELLYQETLQNFIKVVGKDHPETLNCMSNLARLYQSKCQYKKSECMYKSILIINSQLSNRTHFKKRIKASLASLYHSQERYKEAELLCREALRYFEKDLDREHIYAVRCMKILGIIYHSQGRYNEAEILYDKTLKICYKYLNSTSLIYGIKIDLAGLYHSQSRYSEAENLYKEALEYFKRVGPAHPSTLVCKNNLAGLYHSRGEYEKAESIYQEVLQIREQLFGLEHADTLTSINNMAGLHESQGRYEEAESLYKEALLIAEGLFKRTHSFNLKTRNNLAGLYQSQGRYGEAEAIFKEVLQLNKDKLGKKHPDTLQSINNLALLYHNQNRYDKSEFLHKMALKFRIEVLGEQHSDTLKSIHNLAGLYHSLKRYDKAESLYQEVLRLREKVLKKNHPDTLSSINGLAGVYYSQRLFDKAEHLYKKIAQIRRIILGEGHSHTLNSISNLADLYHSQGRYNEAETLYKEALQISEKKQNLGPYHPTTLRIQLKYIIMMNAMNREAIAFCLIKQMEKRLLNRTFQELYNTPEEKTRRLYLDSINQFQSVVFSHSLKYSKLKYARFSAEVMVRWKQVWAEEYMLQHRIMRTDPEMNALKVKISKLRSEFGRTIRNTVENRDITDIYHDINRAESHFRKEIRSKLNKSDLIVKHIKLDQIINNLPDNSVLIEFRQFNPVDFKSGKFGKTSFAAYMLYINENNEPRIIFEDIDIHSLIKYSKKQENIMIDQLYLILFGKFRDRIRNNIERLYIAPDGHLNLITFSDLITSEGKYLVQRYQINRLQTGRDMISLPKKNTKPLLVAFGGVKYGETDKIKGENVISDDIKRSLKILNYSFRASREIESLKYLKNSVEETEMISMIFRNNIKEAEVMIFKNQEATEKALKELHMPPKVLHLSTHGFYLEDNQDNIVGDNQPLILSGLALSGANLGMNGFVDENGDDGLLYSLEVLGLNLQNTELVALSACKTGLGVVDYSEGVYGLVKAFRTAGARSVLMTLAPVGDSASRDFMIQFYKEWLFQVKETSPAEALHKTRLYFIEHKNPNYRHHDFWSPYIIVGGI